MLSNEQLINKRRKVTEKVSSGYRKIATGIGLFGIGLALMMPQLILYDGFTLKLVEHTLPEFTSFLGSLLSVGAMGTGVLTSMVGNCQVGKNKKSLGLIEEEEMAAVSALESEKRSLETRNKTLVNVISGLMPNYNPRNGKTDAEVDDMITYFKRAQKIPSLNNEEKSSFNEDDQEIVEIFRLNGPNENMAGYETVETVQEIKPDELGKSVGKVKSKLLMPCTSLKR